MIIDARILQGISISSLACSYHQGFLYQVKLNRHSQSHNHSNLHPLTQYQSRLSADLFALPCPGLLLILLANCILPMWISCFAESSVTHSQKFKCFSFVPKTALLNLLI